MFDLLKSLAILGFTLWGIYKGFWVLRKIWKWVYFKYECWLYEENFLREIGAQIRAEREAAQHGRISNN